MSLHHARAALAAAAALVAASLPAAADLIVLGGKGSSYQPGTVLSDSQSIDLPAGARLQVMLPSGATQTLSGPLKSAVKDITKGEKVDQGLWDRVGSLVKGGGSERPTGATRSATGGAEKPLPFSWSEVPIDATGDICVEKGAKLSLVRGTTSKQLDITVVEKAAAARAKAIFAEGAGKAAWPSELEPKVGSYLLLVPDRPMREVTLRILSPLPGRAEALRVLHSQRCETQLKALVREIAQGGG